MIDISLLKRFVIGLMRSLNDLWESFSPYLEVFGSTNDRCFNCTRGWSASKSILPPLKDFCSDGQTEFKPFASWFFLERSEVFNEWVTRTTNELAWRAAFESAKKSNIVRYLLKMVDKCWSRKLLELISKLYRKISNRVLSNIIVLLYLLWSLLVPTFLGVASFSFRLL